MALVDTEGIIGDNGFMTRLIPDKIRRYDGGTVLDAEGVEVSRAGLGLPARSTAEQWAEYTALGIGAAQESARYAVDVVEGLEDSEVDEFSDADTTAASRGYGLATAASTIATSDVRGDLLTGVSISNAVAGTVHIFVSAPSAFPSHRLRVVHGRGQATVGTYPGNGQSWAPVTLSGLHSGRQAYLLSTADGSAASAVALRAGDSLQLQIGRPVNTSGLQDRVDDLEAHAVEHYPTLPDVVGFPADAVIVVGEEHYRLEMSTHTVDDEFVIAAVRHTRSGSPSVHWVGASLDISSGHRAFGAIPTNFGGRLGGLWAYNGGHEVTLAAEAYIAAHGSTPSKGQSIFVTLTPEDGVDGWAQAYSFVASIPTEAEFSLSDAIGSGWIPFRASASASTDPSRLYDHGAGHRVTVGIRDGDEVTDDVLFEHDADAASWVRWTRSDNTPDADIVRYQSTRDVQGVPDGAIVVADHALWQATAPDNANTFAGRTERWESGDDVYVGTALADTRYGSRGVFHANLGFAVGALTAGGSVESTIALRLESRLYTQYHGDAVEAGDTVIAQITSGETTTRSTLTYQRSEASAGGDPVYLVFLAHDSDSVLHTLQGGAEWTLQILSAYDETTMTGTPLYTWGTAERHYVEYPVAGVDQAARDSIQADKESVEAELEKLHAYIGHHVAATSETPLDATAADAVDRYYLTRKGRVSNVAMETGLYELTTGVADRLKLTLERITLRDGSTVVHGVNARSFIGPDGGRHFGMLDHNPLSLIQALWMEGDWIHGCIKRSWFRDRANRLTGNSLGGVTFEDSLLWLHIYTAGSTDPIEIEMGQTSAVAGVPAVFVRGDIQYQMFSDHVPSVADKDRIRHLFPFVSGTSGPRESEVTVDVALSPVSHDAHPLTNPHYRLGRAVGDTAAYTWRAATESRLATNFNALIDLLAGGANLAAIPDASLTALKL